MKLVTINDYIGCEIKDIRRGKGARAEFIYAKLYSAKGEVLISATLDYIQEAIKERLP